MLVKILFLLSLVNIFIQLSSADLEYEQGYRIALLLEDVPRNNDMILQYFPSTLARQDGVITEPSGSTQRQTSADLNEMCTVAILQYKQAHSILAPTFDYLPSQSQSSRFTARVIDKANGIKTLYECAKVTILHAGTKSIYITPSDVPTQIEQPRTCVVLHDTDNGVKMVGVVQKVKFPN